MCRTLLALIIFVLTINTNCSTPLDDYVNKPDPNFSWKLLQTYPSSTYTVYILNMTSQQWIDTSFSSQSIWWHYMIITVPKILKRPQTALLLIQGGHNSDPVPTGSSVTEIALQTGTVGVEIQQIPNQPIIFPADPSHMARSEDDIIAWVWKIFIETNGTDPRILLRMPMTKAAVRAMDATEQFLRQQQIQVPQKFVVTGYSKRGWTSNIFHKTINYNEYFVLKAWTTAGVANNRIIAAMPIILDMVNLRQHWKNYYRSIGGWTFSLGSYYAQNITRLLDNPYFQVMADIVDPYAYFDRYRNIKILQFQSADDQYFPPDSEDFFWDDLQKATGGSFLDRIPNVNHSISGHVESLESFYLSALDQQILPLWTWTRTINETHGQIQANVSIGGGHPIPKNVTVYQARTIPGTKRDFRFARVDPTTKQVVANPVKWLQMNNIEITKIGDFQIYTYATPLPPDGQWDGIFMQATFPGPENTTLTLTTETLIIPNTYPVGPCTGEQCYGTLV